MLVSGVIYIGETMQLVGCVCGLVLIIQIAIFFRQHRTIWQEHSAKDFASYESYKRAGILYVFPPFIAARMGQKIGRRPQTQLCGDAFILRSRIMNTRYYDLRGKIVQAERRIAVLTERGEMWAQYNKYKTVHKQLAKIKPEKRELFEQRHSRELILYDAAARYLKELKDSGEEITPKAWQREIDLLTAQKQVDTIDMKAMREELKAVERLRKAADQLARRERDKPRDRGPER